MQNVRPFVVVPVLPGPLEPLRELAYNLWWSWNPAATELFRRLDLELWDRCGHNPVALLARIDQQRLEQAARQPAYLVALQRVMDSFRAYMTSRTWFADHFPEHAGDTIAYFSAEFSVHECMPIYSGGLGVLAGDHLKSASDLGIPLVGVGLMYRHGYFEQQVTRDGVQLESYPTYDFHQWPVTAVNDAEGRPLRVHLSEGPQAMQARVWKAQVGRVPLYLLDSDIPENPPELRAITSRLYGGDTEVRIRQEILLGIGGLRALAALGRRPTACHMNEGHSAFLALERIRQAMKEHGLSFAEAREVVSAGNVFTTHTPVPAGIDKFPPDLVEQHLRWMADELGLGPQEFLGLGRENPGRHDEPFSMPILALRLALRTNAVSRLHGEVSRGMWQSCWPGVPRDEVPITHVTNGIHLASWIARPMAELFDQYLGPAWSEKPGDPQSWARVNEIPDPELWQVHVRLRERLIGYVRQRLARQWARRGAPPAEVRMAEEVLDPGALTIGFARRFAPYKRAALLFRDPRRLEAMVGDARRPVQFIFAGKAHPRDGAGKEILRQVFLATQQPEFRRHIVFLEDYDTDLARQLVQGVDVWLNTPLMLHEASGTSGMKVAPNGGLHVSCLDGWWPEAYNGANGWAIGDGRLYSDLEFQDRMDSEALYALLEREIIPLFYERGDDDLPRGWLTRMKESIRTICPLFNTHRMLAEYTQQLYIPALRRSRSLAEQQFAPARSLSEWKRRLREAWHEVRVLEAHTEPRDVLRVGDSVPVQVRVRLGPIAPQDVAVEIYTGPLTPAGEVRPGQALGMRHVRGEADGVHVYEGAIPCAASGLHGYAIRVVPHHPALADRYDQGLITWG